MSLFQNMPDMVRDAAIGAGITESLTPMAAITEEPQFVVQVSPEVKKAHADGNYSLIEDNRKKTSIDFNPILENFRQRAEKAWFRVKNPSDGIQYLVSIAGPADNPYAYFWQYTYGPNTNDVNTQPIQQFGSLSVNGKFLGVSVSIWNNKAFNLSFDAITLLLGYAIGNFIVERMIASKLGTKMSEIVAKAIEKAGAKAVVERVVESATWKVVAPFLRKLLGELIGGPIVGLLLIFIAQFIYKEFKVAITIYNWDSQNDYVIADRPAGSNEKIDGDQDWYSLKIPKPQSSFKPPNGFPIPTQTIYQYAGYVFANENKFLQGVGAAITVKLASDASKGFAVKYYCPFVGKNTLGMTGAVPASPLTYYNNNQWEPTGTQAAKSTISNIGVDISCSTPKLQGAEDDIYYFDVNIGLKPSAGYGEPPRENPPEMLLPEPGLPQLPEIGQQITAPSGEKLEVVGRFDDSAPEEAG